MEYKYKTIVIGGTFDRLHEGHKTFLRFAFSLGEKVYVTITSDSYTKIHKPFAAPFIERESLVKSFLHREGLSSRVEFFPIDTVFGITADMQRGIEAIAVTEETLTGSQMVNKKRKKMGLPALVVEVMPHILSEAGIPISSSYIRNGVIDEKGNVLIKKEIIQNISHMPESLRSTLHEPFGKILTGGNVEEIAKKKLIAVGDVTTHTLHQSGFSPVLSVIDFVVERKKQETTLQDLGFSGEEKIYHVTNPASTLTPQMWESISGAFVDIRNGNKVGIIIDGEEDLAVLPILILAPLGYVVCYGQPHVGMVVVEVDKKVKEHMLELIASFIPGTTRGH